MQPVLKERIWGGRRLADLLNKAIPPDLKIGESWELADHPHGRSVVAEGPLAGKTLRWILERYSAAVLGRDELARGAAARFGVLVKFVDASERLSLQVHPDDAYAGAHHVGESGKTECWTIIHAEPDAWVINGVKPGCTRAQFAEALKKGTVEEMVVKRPVRTGDFLWVPAGTVHALGPGIVIAEVQQNSDLTYRVYDWGRKDAAGKPRELHIKDALATIRFDGDMMTSGGRGKTADETGLTIEHLVDCHAFSLSRIQLDRRPWATDTSEAYVVLVVLAGAARLTTREGSMPVVAGDTVLVPAEAGEYALESPQKLTVLVAAPQGKAPTQ
jgi:mannose-6-phosphate isomerase